jgi:DNA-binding transcriptional LysR family regulator
MILESAPSMSRSPSRVGSTAAAPIFSSSHSHYASDHAADSIVVPKLAKLPPGYPDIKVEVNTRYQLVDIVAERFDAKVRLGEQVARDRIAARIGQDTLMAVVGSSVEGNEILMADSAR